MILSNFLKVIFVSGLILCIGNPALAIDEGGGDEESTYTINLDTLVADGAANCLEIDSAKGCSRCVRGIKKQVGSIFKGLQKLGIISSDERKDFLKNGQETMKAYKSECPDGNSDDSEDKKDKDSDKESDKGDEKKGEKENKKGDKEKDEGASDKPNKGGDSKEGGEQKPPQDK